MWLDRVGVTWPGSDSVRFPLDRWFCLQVDLNVHPQDGSVLVRVDGDAAVTGSMENTQPPGADWVFGAGLEWTDPAQGSIGVFADALVISESAIPCL